MSSKTSEIFEFNKMISIYLITIVVSTVYLLHFVIRREKIILSVLFIPILLFLLSQILSTLFSIDVHTSIFGYYGRWNGGLLSIISYITLFYIGVQTLNVYHVKRLLLISLITSALVIVWGLPGKFGLDLSCYVFTGQLTNTCWTNEFNPAERMFSTLGQPNWFGAYLAIHFFIGLYFLIVRINKRHPEPVQFDGLSIFYLSYIVVNLFVIFFTKSRSALLAVFSGMVIAAFIFFKEYLRIKELTKKIIYGIVCFLLVAGIFWSIQSGVVSNMFSLPSQTSAITDSFDIRKVVWKGAIDLGNRYPLFGSGVETFAYAYYFTRPPEHNLTSEWDFIYNKAHNEYLNYFATTGYFGLASYLLFIVGFYILCIYTLSKLQDTDKRILVQSVMLAYTTIVITNFFGFSISSVQIFFYLLPVAVIVIHRGENVHESYSFKSFSRGTKMLAAFIIMSGLTGIYYMYNYYSADRLYAQSRIDIENSEYTEAYRKLSLALGKRYEHIYEDKLSNTAANLAFLDSFSENKNLVSKLISFSKDLNNHTLQISHKNILYLRTKGKNHYLYYQANHSEVDLQKAVTAMEDAVKIGKTDVQSKYTLALFYYIASKEISDKKVSAEYLNKTKITLEQIQIMKPNYIEAQELYTEIINKE
jgi:hypothetical protein